MNTSVPSGYEVHSASFHPPLSKGTAIEKSQRGRIDGLKSKAVELKQSLQRRQSEWKDRAGQSLAVRRAELTSMTRQRSAQMQASMAAEPMKWAGIAAGSGLLLGLIGRYAHWRKAHRASPTLVVIETSC
jgi:hypothetical protein